MEVVVGGRVQYYCVVLGCVEIQSRLSGMGTVTLGLAELR